MFLATNEKAQAVLFFSSNGIAKEFLYPEFEALLDGFVPLEEWAGRTVRSVYLEIDHRLNVVAAVFFLTVFDTKGAVDASWNIPLADLARTTTKGPDMGSGQIHLACASLCPIAFYRDKLWDPELGKNSRYLKIIKDAVKTNKMGLHFKAVSRSSDRTLLKDAESGAAQSGGELHELYERELRDRLAQLLKEQRVKTAVLNSERELALRELRVEHAERLEELRRESVDKDRVLQDLQKRNLELNDTIEGQARKIDGLREYFEHKLQRNHGGEQLSLDTLRRHLELEQAEKIASATRELSERLKMKELELLYRLEHEQQLRDEIDRLRRENRELAAESGDQLLEKLSRKGVNFVTYQAGAGHITIPLTEVNRFVQNPAAFTADYCGVSEQHYLAWLKHYQTPVCCAIDARGEPCNLNIPRVSSPARFVIGESEFCVQHNRARRGVSLTVVPAK